jgi:hypothetical protein
LADLAEAALAFGVSADSDFVPNWLDKSPTTHVGGVTK